MAKRVFDLEVRTLAFAKEVIRLCQQLRENRINHELVSQLVRAAGSVGANYREANDASSARDFTHRIKVALREAKEAQFWLQLISEANPQLDGDISRLTQEALELRKIFSKIANRSS